jgi:hypothetical protein
MFEANHYFIQHFRIPLYEKPNFYNLMKIAYYAGLLNPIKDQVNEGHINRYVQYRLDDIYAFTSDIENMEVDEVALKKISDVIDFLELALQKGGFRIFKKYKKYKKKYLVSKYYNTS